MIMSTDHPALDTEVISRLHEVVADLGRVGALWGPEQLQSNRDAEALAKVVERLRNMYPYGDPRYIGQILKPPHPVAWAAYAATALINPNNHALDGGPATAQMEKEAVEELARMFGMPRHLGHLTSSGTIANLEALYVSRELQPDGVVLSSEAAHYTHKRMCDLLGVRHETVAQDGSGRMDVEALAQRLEKGGVSVVVATLGTTSLGALDPVHEIVELAREHGVRVHVDAAYGGFHTLLAGASPAVDPSPFAALPHVDSIVVDPHKHGLQPYGCGSVLFADPGVGRLYAHDSPYTYFTSDELHLGEISLECSRAGASAAAFWATIQALPLNADGLGRGLRDGRRAALRVAERLNEDPSVRLVVQPDLDIVCYYPSLSSASAVTAASDAVFDSLARDGWHVAKLTVDVSWLNAAGGELQPDADSVTVLRSCIMKPEHVEVADDFADAVIGAFRGVRSP
ncbi:aspartate aminotransferase family protein [Pseudoclavibacter endophyticus]|nr:aspartate aminotransferase family protein [Pseudoclavibacter endophyticus]